MKLVDDILESHLNDGDGGYAAVSELRRRMDELDEQHRREVVSSLVDLALQEKSTRLGVALETLAQEKSTIAAEAIFAHLSSVHDEDWQRELMRALMRIGHTAHAARLRQYLLDCIPRLAGGDVTLVAAFANVDPEMSAELAARLWIGMYAVGRAKAFIAYLPSLLINYAETRPDLVGEMLRLVGRINTEAVAGLVAEIEAYLEKPWANRQLGHEPWALIRAAMDKVKVASDHLDLSNSESE